MAKDPHRHGSAAAFRYELNTVMDMLDMGRRRSRGSGAMSPEKPARHRSPGVRSLALPQAIMSVDGVFVATNRAFNKLVNQDEKGDGLILADTTLTTFVPASCARCAASTSMASRSSAARRCFAATIACRTSYRFGSPLPIPGQKIHMLVRVEEIDPRREQER